MILSTAFYYVIYSSAFLLYGIGINRLLVLRENFSSLMLTFVKTLLTASSAAAISYLMVQRLLVPAGLSELYPFVVVLVYASISIIIEFFLSIGVGNSVTELTIPLLSLILALNESTGLIQAELAVCACICAFYVLVGIIYAIRLRFTTFAPKSGFWVYVLLLVSLAVIVIALRAWDVSWLTLLKA